MWENLGNTILHAYLGKTLAGEEDQVVEDFRPAMGKNGISATPVDQKQIKLREMLLVLSNTQ